MVFPAHSDADYFNASKSRSRASYHILLSEDDPAPAYNSPFLTITQIIKLAMSSAAKSKLSGLFIRAK